MSEGYIQQYSPETEVFFVRGGKIPEGSKLCPRAEGPRARRAALVNFPALDEKHLGFGAILLDIALRDPIYTLHISFFVGYIRK